MHVRTKARKHASPARVTYETSAYETYHGSTSFFLLPPPSSSFSLGNPSGYPVSLLPQGSNFLRLPNPPSPPSPRFAASLFLTIRENRGSVVIVRVWVHTRTYVQEHAWRRSCLAFSLNGPRLLSPVYHHGRPRTPSAANLSLATPSLANPLASHFSPPTKHAQSCGIKTQATGGGVAVHARGPAPGD